MHALSPHAVVRCKSNQINPPRVWPQGRKGCWTGHWRGAKGWAEGRGLGTGGCCVAGRCAQGGGEGRRAAGGGLCLVCVEGGGTGRPIGEIAVAVCGLPQDSASAGRPSAKKAAAWLVLGSGCIIELCAYKVGPTHAVVCYKSNQVAAAVGGRHLTLRSAAVRGRDGLFRSALSAVAAKQAPHHLRCSFVLSLPHPAVSFSRME